MSLLDTKTRNAQVVSKSVPIGDSIKLGRMEYNMIRPSSLVVARKMIVHDAQSTSYTAGQNITTFLSTGDDAVWGRGSFLRFDVVFDGADGTVGANGSAVNLIDNIALYHSSGTPILRIENVNLRHMINQVSTKSTAYLSSTAKSWGRNATLTDGTTYKYSIPLKDLCDFWNRDILTPAMLHSGIKVVIGLASQATSTSTTGSVFTVSNPAFHMDCLTLTDSANQWLQQRSASQGLVYPFKSYEHVSTAPGAATSYNINVLRAVSQAGFAVGCLRTTANVGVITADSFLPITIGADETKTMSVQWRLSGLYMPNKSLTTLSENYMWNRLQWDNVDHDLGFGVDTVANSGIMALNLERDTYLINGNGHPVSGSRALNLAVTCGSSVARTLDVFMDFTKLARVYLYDKVLIQS